MGLGSVDEPFITCWSKRGMSCLRIKSVCVCGGGAWVEIHAPELPSIKGKYLKTDRTFRLKNAVATHLITSEREARSEFLLIYTKNLSMSGRPAGRPWSRFWETYISGTVSPIDKRSSLVGSSIPSAVHGTNAESCQCQLGHVARATWGDVTNGAFHDRSTKP